MLEGLHPSEDTAMTPTPAHTALHHVRGLLAAQEAPGDRRLLERFAAGREEAAFEALVRRHGAMVLGVCRRVLGPGPDADDAFQTAFLTLVTKGGTAGRTGSVAGWLYRVAYRAALKARASAAARRRREGRAGARPPADPLAEITGRELLAALDEELHKLADGVRAPLVLCYLEGKTREEAARQLGWSLGTLKRRLDQGRQRLRRRLERRGLALPGLLLAAGVAIPVPRALATAAARLALRGAAAAGPRLRLAAAVLVLAGLAAAGSAVLAPQRPAAADDSPPAPARPAPAAAPGEQEMVIRGRVAGADGKPVAASVAVAAGPYTDHGVYGPFGKPDLLGQVRADGQGRFRLVVPQTSSLRHYLVKALAAAPGHGLGEVLLDPNLPDQEVSIHLPAEQRIEGHLIGLQGEPVAGAQVRVHHVWGAGRAFLVAWFSEPLEGWSGWPAPVRTDAGGRFRIGGLAPGLTVTLRVADGRHAVQDRAVDTREDGRPAELTWPLPPALLLEGTVRAADTRAPLPHARVEVESLVKDTSGVLRQGATLEARADERGRYRINPADGAEFHITASPPPGQPYLRVTEEVTRPRGVTRQTFDLLLPRGVLIRGRVREARSGEPVAGAAVHYRPRGDFLPQPGTSPWAGETITAADGRFTLAVPPRAGALLVKAPTPDYLHAQTSDGMFLPGQKPAGRRYYPDGLVALDPRIGGPAPEVDVRLRRGITLEGRLVDPDGRPVKVAWMFCPSYIPVGYAYPGQPAPVREGRFEIPGFDPEGKMRVWFLDNVRELGATAELTGREAAGGPVRVKLERCGGVAVRLVDGKGRPLDSSTPLFLQLVVAPGESWPLPWGQELKGLAADTAAGGHFARWSVDDRGVRTVGRLIPGATYRISGPLGPGGRPAKDFVVEAGKVRRLPDLEVGP
jgi:RNA polymerase sigma factor (sigma-70 family)